MDSKGGTTTQAQNFLLNNFGFSTSGASTK
jgi:hypothetical protein